MKQRVARLMVRPSRLTPASGGSQNVSELVLPVGCVCADAREPSAADDNNLRGSVMIVIGVSARAGQPGGRSKAIMCKQLVPMFERLRHTYTDQTCALAAAGPPSSLPGPYWWSPPLPPSTFSTGPADQWTRFAQHIGACLRCVHSLRLCEQQHPQPEQMHSRSEWMFAVGGRRSGDRRPPVNQTPFP
jgi:hypothetical protein